MLDGLATEVTRLTGTLKEHRNQLASGLNDLASVTAGLRESCQDLDTFLKRGPGFLDLTNRLLTASRPGLGCLLTAVGTPSTPLFTPGAQARLTEILRLVPNARALLKDIIEPGPNGNAFARTMPLITIDGHPQSKEYSAP